MTEEYKITKDLETLEKLCDNIDMMLDDLYYPEHLGTEEEVDEIWRLAEELQNKVYQGIENIKNNYT